MATFPNYYHNIDVSRRLDRRSAISVDKSKSLDTHRFKPYHKQMRETNRFNRKTFGRDIRHRDSQSEDLFSFMVNSPSKAAKFDARLANFRQNVPNLVNTSPTKMKQLKDRFNLEKRFDINCFRTSLPNIRPSHKYNNNIIDNQTYNTVFVTKFERPKPSKLEIFNFFKKFGSIADITTNSNTKKCSYAFIRYESCSDAYKLSNSEKAIKFSYKCVKNCKVLVMPRPRNCYGDDCFELIAASQTISDERIAEKIRNLDRIDEQIVTLCDELLLTDSDIENRKQIVIKLQSLLNSKGFWCKFYVFGSCINKLGFRDTDIDIFVEMPYLNNMTEKLDYTSALKLLHEIRAALTKSLGMFIPKPIESKKCPILRLDFKHMSDNLRANGITCDISITNSFGILNSKLVSFLCDFEPRFRQLSIVLRYWAKINDFIGSTQMSSYAFSMLIIFFCQKQAPPLLPKICLLKEMVQINIDIVDENRSFCTNKDLIRSVFTEFNHQSVAQLIPQFFGFYAMFKFEEIVICPYYGRSIPKRKFHEIPSLAENNVQALPENKFKITNYCCIQDPIDKCINLTGHTRYHVFERFVKHIRNIDNYFNSIKNTETNGYWCLSKLLPVDNDFECVEIDDNDSDDYCYVSEEETSGYFDKFSIGKVKVNFEDKHSDDSLLLNKLNDMTNIIRKEVDKLLNYCYGFDCSILDESDIKLYEESTFAKIICKFRGWDKMVIDEWNREPALHKLKLDNSVQYIEREKLVSDNIRRELPYPRQQIIPVHITFDLVLDTRSPEYFVIFCTQNIHPDVQYENGFIDFLRKNVRKYVETERLLNIDDEIIILFDNIQT